MIRIIAVIIFSSCSFIACRSLQYETKPVSDPLQMFLSQEYNYSDSEDSQKKYITRRALQSWLLFLEQSDLFPVNSLAFNPSYIPVGVEIQSVKMEEETSDIPNLSDISLYDIDFSNAIQISDLGENICYRKDTILTQASILRCSFGSSQQVKISVESVKKSGFIIAESRSRRKLYFLSQNFISYDYSIWQLWDDFYKSHATPNGLEGDSIPPDHSIYKLL